MIDFSRSVRTMLLTGPEDRALLGSNPSAAAGDGNHRRSQLSFAWLRHPLSSGLVLVPNAINPRLIPHLQPTLKSGLSNQPVCHMSISWLRRGGCREAADGVVRSAKQ